ncbi:hypothetical protein key_131 [Erwinia phage KEY]|uniref:Lipoprotein n=2 Tax=Keyvirus TaxID=3152642 RepID=A0AAE7WB22_9CAUD|nr:hypothetical protein AAS21_gp144 [Pantoea phage vB_PagS_AAS21]QYC51622.1 hypothetical protein key_131 [Erwinia phage KEY]
MRKMILVSCLALVLTLVLTGCDEQQRMDYESAAQSCVKNNGILVKTVSFSKIYLFGLIPVGTNMTVYCQVNPTVGAD